LIDEVQKYAAVARAAVLAERARLLQVTVEFHSRMKGRLSTFSEQAIPPCRHFDLCSGVSACRFAFAGDACCSSCVSLYIFRRISRFRDAL
jgi:hypothetical protein